VAHEMRVPPTKTAEIALSDDEWCVSHFDPVRSNLPVVDNLEAVSETVLTLLIVDFHIPLSHIARHDHGELNVNAHVNASDVDESDRIWLYHSKMNSL
jgi:hypothetical protein